MSRYRLKGNGGRYFPPTVTLKFIKTGCTPLDCVLGGGWPLGRIANVVGDKAVGKTLLAIEACANFAFQYPNAHIWYREAEAAFDESYAAKLGLPLKRVDFGAEGIETVWDTVEDIFEDLDLCIAKSEATSKPGLYIIDSLDALSSREEMKRDIDKGSYKTEKAKVMSELFRRLSRKIKKTKICLIIISQTRDRIGITFGDKKTRSGGKAMDFYASQILYLSHIKYLTRKIKGNKRVTGVRVRAKCKKNKVGLPFRECEFIIRFMYGVDDVAACLAWLDDAGKLKGAALDKRELELARLEDKDFDAFHTAVVKLQDEVRTNWDKVEGDFEPPHKKYGRRDEAQA